MTKPAETLENPELPPLIQEAEVIENTLYFLALTEEQQAQVAALPDERAKRLRLAAFLAATPLNNWPAG